VERTVTAAELVKLADSIGQRLGNKHADRQTICEDVAAKLRQMATSARIADQRAVPVPGVAAGLRQLAAVDPVSADRRVDEARAYLEQARPRHDVLLPASVLTSMFYDLRRHALELLRVIVEMHYAEGAAQYCTTCGEWAGIFVGVIGWHHFRGDPSPGGQRTLYDADHEAVIGWCHSPGLALSPAGHVVVGLALADAVNFRDPSGQCRDCDESPAGLWEDHAADLDKADAYLELARQLEIEVDR
jgi:hypothetical protein